MTKQSDPQENTATADTADDDTAAATVRIPIPATNTELFRHTATNDVLRLLLDNPYESFTIRALSRLTDHSVYSIKSSIDVLAENKLVIATPEGNRRLVRINRSRANKPDEPVLQIPQSEFHRPVKTALDELRDEVDEVLGVLVFGSVARGQADRQSDIDLWVLVGDGDGEQHRVNEIAKELGQKQFDGDRYEFQIMVESDDSARSYADRLREIFTDAITLYSTETLQELKREILSNA